jgi:hypothetical protein
MTNESRVLSLVVERGGKTASYEVHGGVALVGSGSHCDVRLLPEDAAAEQLRVELRDGDIFVQSLSLEHDCRLDGLPFRHGMLPTEAQLELGYASLRLRLTQNQDRKKGQKSEGWPAPVRILCMAVIAAGAYNALRAKPVVSFLDQTVEHPALFGAAVTQCSASGDRETAFHASRLIREANLQSERAPFYPRDGVSAVGRYEEAAACLSSEGRTNDAKALSHAAVALRDSLSDQFHVRHVRLERFLSVKKYDAAQREVRVLQDFLARREGPYAQWLAGVQRELNTRFASAKKKG